MTMLHTRPLAQGTLHLQDPRPPQDIQALLERQTQAVLHPLDPAQRQARWRQGALHYQMTLRLDAVLAQRHAYTVHIQADTGQPLAEADSWRLIYRLMEGPGPSLWALAHGAR